MKKRNILFGYQYQNGVIAIHPQEVAVINRIFSEYQNGMSLLDIATQLNDEKVEYQPGVTGWNKCRTVIHKADSDLLDDITVLLNWLIVNPELVQIPAEPEHEPNVQVHKAENEIARTLDALDYDKNALRKKMMECVSLKFAEIESAPYIAHGLKATLADAEPLSTFSLPLFKRTVQEIHLSKNGTVSIRLINDQMVGKDDKNATDSNYSAESSAKNTCQD